MGGKPLLLEPVCHDTRLRKAPDRFVHFNVNMSVVHFVVEVILLDDPGGGGTIQLGCACICICQVALKGKNSSRCIYFAFCMLSMLFQCIFDNAMSAVLVVSSPG